MKITIDYRKKIPYTFPTQGNKRSNGGDFMIREFTQQGDFAATNAAESFLKEAGFSLGTMCRGLPRGVMFGDYQIEKYRNLSRDERNILHGELTGDGRNGPVKIVIFDSAPPEAKAAFLVKKAT